MTSFKQKVFALALLGLISGCAPKVIDRGFLQSQGGADVHSMLPILITVDPAMDVHVLDVSDAEEYWDTVVGVNAFMLVGVLGREDAELSTNFYCHPDPITVCETQLYFNEGTGLISSSNVACDCSENPAKIRLAIRHEMGHLLGLADDTDPKSLMGDYLKGQLTPSDAEKLHEKYLGPDAGE